MKKLKTVACLSHFPDDNLWLLLGVGVGVVLQFLDWSVFGGKMEIVLIGTLAALDVYIGAYFVRSCLKGRGRGGWSYELAMKELAERKGKISARRVAYIWMGFAFFAKAMVLFGTLVGRWFVYTAWRIL